MMALATTLLAGESPAQSDNWPQFRGPRGDGVANAGQIPTEWSNEQNLAWKIRLPGAGWSQPVIFKGVVYLTTAVSDQLARPKSYADGLADPHTVSGGKARAPDVNIAWEIMAFDLLKGTPLWTRTAVSGKPKYPIHPSNTYASETPAVDAQGVYTWYGAAGLLTAFDHSGGLLWQRDLGALRQQENLGTGSSLRLHQGLLYVQCFGEDQAFLVCLDTREGKEKWRLTREKAGTAWTTPLLWQNKQRSELIVYGQHLMTSHDPLTGREIWRASGVDMAGPSSITGDASQLYFGFRSALKRTSLYALAVGAEGDQSVAEGTKTFRCETWATAGAAPGMSSPVVADGCVYVLNDAFASCYAADTGKEYFKERLPGFHCVVASPIVVGHQVVILDESGGGVVLQTGPKFEIAGRSKLEDTFWASPVAANGSLVLRGVEYLYCIRE